MEGIQCGSSQRSWRRTGRVLRILWIAAPPSHMQVNLRIGFHLQLLSHIPLSIDSKDICGFGANLKRNWTADFSFRKGIKSHIQETKINLNLFDLAKSNIKYMQILWLSPSNSDAFSLSSPLNCKKRLIILMMKGMHRYYIYILDV